MTRGHIALAAALALAAGSLASAGDVTLTTLASGDAQYAWNSRYGPWGYNVGGDSIGVGLQMGGQYGNDYTIGIVEIPIATLIGHDLDSAVLYLHSLGFGTGYYYGSANLGWQNNNGATGDVVVDGRGPLGLGETIAQIWNSDWGHDASGLKNFDVLTCVRSDLEAGRTFSTFVIAGSRDTSGGIKTAEGGAPAYLIASATTLVPEPASLTWLLLAACTCRRTRNRRPSTT